MKECYNTNSEKNSVAGVRQHGVHIIGFPFWVFPRFFFLFFARGVSGASDVESYADEHVCLFVAAENITNQRKRIIIIRIAFGVRAVRACVLACSRALRPLFHHRPPSSFFVLSCRDSDKSSRRACLARSTFTSCSTQRRTQQWGRARLVCEDPTPKTRPFFLPGGGLFLSVVCFIFISCSARILRQYARRWN